MDPGTVSVTSERKSCILLMVVMDFSLRKIQWSHIHQLYTVIYARDKWTYPCLCLRRERCKQTFHCYGKWLIRQVFKADLVVANGRPQRMPLGQIQANDDGGKLLFDRGTLGGPHICGSSRNRKKIECYFPKSWHEVEPYKVYRASNSGFAWYQQSSQAQPWWLQIQRQLLPWPWPWPSSLERVGILHGWGILKAPTHMYLYVYIRILHIFFKN